jgi:ketosteroid isomerase-like protein
MAVNDLEGVIEQSHLAVGEFVKGNPEPFLNLYSRRDDASLGNPFGPFVIGWQQVAETAAAAATLYRDGEVVGVESVARYIAGELACVVEVERFRTKVGGSDGLAEVSLRVTSLFRLEDGTWKLVHRHPDPITTPQSSDSVMQR